MPLRLALKVDVDTDRGTREGVPNLLADLREQGATACFLFSLGPDQTGRAITRVLRPGFFKKVSRTSVVSIYGVRTLLNGTLLPAPHIGRRNAAVMRAARRVIAPDLAPALRAVAILHAHPKRPARTHRAKRGDHGLIQRDPIQMRGEGLQS